MSDMKTIMENFRQFERNDMENKTEKLLKENKNLKKRLNKTRKLKEGALERVHDYFGAPSRAGAMARQLKLVKKGLWAIVSAVVKFQQIGGAEPGYEPCRPFAIDIKSGDIVLAEWNPETPQKKSGPIIPDHISSFLIKSLNVKGLKYVETTVSGHVARAELVGSFEMDACKLRTVLDWLIQDAFNPEYWKKGFYDGPPQQQELSNSGSATAAVSPGYGDGGPMAGPDGSCPDGFGPKNADGFCPPMNESQNKKYLQKVTKEKLKKGIREAFGSGSRARQTKMNNDFKVIQNNLSDLSKFGLGAYGALRCGEGKGIPDRKIILSWAKSQRYDNFDVEHYARRDLMCRNDIDYTLGGGDIDYVNMIKMMRQFEKVHAPKEPGRFADHAEFVNRVEAALRKIFSRRRPGGRFIRSDDTLKVLIIAEKTKIFYHGLVTNVALESISVSNDIVTENKRRRATHPVTKKEWWYNA